MSSKWANNTTLDLEPLCNLSKDKENFLTELDYIKVFEEMRRQSEKTICGIEKKYTNITLR